MLARIPDSRFDLLNRLARVGRDLVGYCGGAEEIEHVELHGAIVFRAHGVGMLPAAGIVLNGGDLIPLEKYLLRILSCAEQKIDAATIEASLRVRHFAEQAPENSRSGSGREREGEESQQYFEAIGVVAFGRKNIDDRGDEQAQRQNCDDKPCEKNERNENPIVAEDDRFCRRGIHADGHSFFEFTTAKSELQIPHC
jgi:hypothetical protein